MLLLNANTMDRIGGPTSPLEILADPLYLEKAVRSA